MSYDFSLVVDTGGPHPAEIESGIGDINLTYNLSKMWRAAGVDIRGLDGRVAADCVKEVDDALINLRAQPDYFKPMNPPNGWGDYEGLCWTLSRLLDAFQAHPKAIVQVR